MMDENAIPAGSIPPVAEEALDTEPQAPVVEPPKEEPQLLAGKYKSADELANAYTELSRKLGEKGNTEGELKAQNKLLMEQLQYLQQNKSKEVKQARNEEPPTDYEKMLQDISDQADNGDISLKEALLKSNEITRQMTAAELEKRTQSVLEQATNSFQQTLAERDNQAVVGKFNETNPDFQQLRDSGELAKIAQSNPMHDEFSAYFAYQAEQAKQQAAEAFERGKAEAARIAAGSEPAAKVLSKPGQSIQATNKSNKPMSKAERRASMLKVIGADE